MNKAYYTPHLHLHIPGPSKVRKIKQFVIYYALSYNKVYVIENKCLNKFVLNIYYHLQFLKCHESLGCLKNVRQSFKFFSSTIERHNNWKHYNNRDHDSAIKNRVILWFYPKAI